MTAALPIESLLATLRRRTPAIPLTWALIAANGLVFAAMLVNGAGFWHSPNNVQLAWGANFGPATQDGEWWRLASAMFLHFGILHLSMNLWALWDAGQFVERLYGPLRFIAIYLCGGIFGNLLSLVAQRGQTVSGGASGAIFGLYAALIVALWCERRHLHPREFRWLFWGACVFAALTIVLGFQIPGIDNAAHLGGFACGLLVGIVLHRPLAGTRQTPAAWRLGALVLAAGVVALCVGRIPEPRYRWQDEAAARREIGTFLANDASIGNAWQDIVRDGQRGNVSFEQLAGRIDETIVERYQESFEHLSSLHVDPDMPSASAVTSLRRYAEQRREASRRLAESLRDGRESEIREALRQWQTVAPNRAPDSGH